MRGIPAMVGRAATRSKPLLLAGVVLLVPSCGGDSGGRAPRSFADPEVVTLLGYRGDAMEPFLTRDGRFLLFNDRNDPTVDTDLFFAERVDDLTFRVRGELRGANSASLDAVATMDRDGTVYFVSSRSYPQTFSTIYRGVFSGRAVTDVVLVPGVSRKQPGMVNFDVEISPNGETMYFVDARFDADGNAETADIAIAERSGDGFARLVESAEILRKVNTSELEYAACISADGLLLLFTRASPGRDALPEIFMARRKHGDESFDEPEQLTALDGFVEAPALSADERALYFHKLVDGTFAIFRARRQ